jgi:hypothetical protein
MLNFSGENFIRNNISITHLIPSHYLIPLPLLPREKGRKKKYFLAPLPWERGWGEVLTNLKDNQQMASL